MRGMTRRPRDADDWSDFSPLRKFGVFILMVAVTIMGLLFLFGSAVMAAERAASGLWVDAGLLAIQQGLIWLIVWVAMEMMQR